jgi:nicotinate dehydrogenase subunit A
MNKLSIARVQAIRVFCLYTNDLARAAETCQAASQPKKTRCRIKIQLPKAAVHKSGKPFGREMPSLHVCMQTVSSQGFRAVFATQHRSGTTSMTQSTIRLTVNGRIHDVTAAPDTALLYVLRNDLELNGPKYGCGLGECGACTVLIDGVAARSCVIPIDGCVGRDILTLEGLGSRDHPDPVQHAFIKEQAAQCGYCLNGMIMATKALLNRTPQPSETDMREALRHHLCRCGAHVEIMRAVKRAAGYAAEARD